MTKLIGGNISDTPIKDISDGSAFSVGGAGSGPAVVTIGAVPSTGTTLSNIDSTARSSITNGQTQKAAGIVKWADNSFGVFWLTHSPSTPIYYSHVQTNSDGTFLSDGTKVDLQGDFSSNGNSNRGMGVKKVSASRVAFLYGMGPTASLWRLQTATYDKSGDTLVEHGTIVDLGYVANNNVYALAGLNLAIRDTDTAAVFNQWVLNDLDNNSCHPIKITTTKSIGTRVDSTASSREGIGGVSFTDDTGKIWTIQGTSSFGNSTLQEWTVTAGSPPSVSSPTGYSGWQRAVSGAFSGTEVQSDAGFDNGGGVGVVLVNRNDVERGAFLAAQTGAGQLGFYAGVTTNSSGTIDLGFVRGAGDIFGGSGSGALLLEVDYNATTFWGRYIYVNCDTGGNIYLVPFNFNWSTYELIKADSSDLPYKSTGITIAAGNRVWGVLKGSDSATNIVIIYDEGSSDIRYLNVPISG